VAPTVALRFGFNDVAANDDTGNFTLRSLVSEFLDLNDNQTVDVGDDITLTNVKHLRIALSAASGNAITVPITFSGTASGDVDDDAVCDNNIDDFFISTNADVTTTYSAGTYSASVVIPAGETYYELEVNVCNDTWFDPSETIVATIGTPTNANLSATYTSSIEIEDQEGAPAIQFTTLSQDVQETLLGAPNIVSGFTAVDVTATLSHPSQAIIIAPLLISGTATLGTDYTINSQSISFAPNITIGSTTITVSDDAIYEPNEQIVISFSNSLSGAYPHAINPTTQTIVISETGDDLPTLTFVDQTPTFAENIGLATVNISLTKTCSSGLVLNFNPTIGGTAEKLPNSPYYDHDLVIPLLIVPALSNSATLGFNITNDVVYEGDETLTFTLDTATCNGVSIISNPVFPITVTATITDDESLPLVSYQLSQLSLSESSGTTNITIKSNIMSESDMTITTGVSSVGIDGVNPVQDGPSNNYQYATYVAGAPSWDTVADVNFNNSVGETTTTKVITGYSTTTTVPITIINDSFFEYDEKLILNLSSGAGYTVPALPYLTVNILNDDTPPYLHLSSANNSISNFPNINEPLFVDEYETVTYYVVLTTGSLTTSNLINSISDIKVPISATLVSGGSASYGQDFSYGSYPNISISISPTDLNPYDSFEIDYLTDSLYEEDETFNLTMGIITNGYPGQQSVVSFNIIDTEDHMPLIKLVSPYGRGFYEHQGSVSFELKRQKTGKDSIITYTICEESSCSANFSTATTGIDHTLTSGTITIPGDRTSNFSDENDLSSSTIDDFTETITFNIVDDALAEAEERIVIKFHSDDFDFDLVAGGATDDEIIENYYIFTSDKIQTATGSEVACALYQGQVKCWGSIEYTGRGIAASAGNYGDLAGETLANQVPVDLGSNFTPIKIVAGSKHVCALSSSGYVKCWGDVTKGATGSPELVASTYIIGDQSNEMGDYLSVLPIGEQVMDISASAEHSCALTISGQVKCWGWNSWANEASYGALGILRANYTTENVDVFPDDECVSNLYRSKTECIGDYAGELAASSFAELPSGTSRAYKLMTSYQLTCAYYDDQKTYCFGNTSAGSNPGIEAANFSSNIKHLFGTPFSATLCANSTSSQTDSIACLLDPADPADDDPTNISSIAGTFIGSASLSGLEIGCYINYVTSPSRIVCGSFEANDVTSTTSLTNYSMTDLSMGDDYGCVTIGENQIGCFGENAGGMLLWSQDSTGDTTTGPTGLSVQTFQ
jgi:hypothetical protein